MGKQWTEPQVEELLRRAVGRSVPDVYDRVAQAPVAPLLNPDDIVPAAPARPRRRFRRLALALCAVLALVLGVGSFLYFNTAAIISLGAEPDVELAVNRFGRVLSASGTSEAGEAILDGLTLRHADLDDALDQVAAGMAETGYLERGGDIPVRVDGGDWKYNRTLLEETCEQMEEAAGRAGSGSHFVAQETGAAQGSAVLPAASASPAPSETEAPSAAPSDSQTAGGVPTAAATPTPAPRQSAPAVIPPPVSASTPTPAPSPTPAAASGAVLTAQEAQAAALADAGLSAGDVLFESVELDRYRGVLHYDLEFVSGDTEYEYEIDAATGAVLDRKSENKFSGSALTAQQAGQIALDHAGYTAGGVQDLEVELDEEDGVLCYQVEFKAGGTEYEYEIDAADGSIRKAEQD